MANQLQQRVRFPRSRIAALALCLALVSGTAYGAGTPDSGGLPLTATNQNQLLETIGPDRGFFAGNYVYDASEGLQSFLGTVTYDYYIEVPPGLAQLTVEIFDADIGAGDIAGSDANDQCQGGCATTVTYELQEPGLAPTASISLPPQDCDPGMAGNQTGCDNTWSDLGVFTILNPLPGHWRLSIGNPPSPAEEDDANGYGVRAHDGDPSAAGTELNVYADTYISIGQVYTDSGDTELSRTYDLFPYVNLGCVADSNDFDSDASGDELLTFQTRQGISPAGSPAPVGPGTLWANNELSAFTDGVDATDYGLWSLSFVTGNFNHITYWMGSELAVDPENTPPGNGSEPTSQPVVQALRIYMPEDGSAFFDTTDVINPPVKPWVGHSWALLPGELPIEVGFTSRVEVTITVDNPTPWPIQFDAATAGSLVANAFVPTNAGQTVYVAGSAAITGGSSTAVAESGAGPWNLTFAPGVIAAGTTASLTYQIDVTPVAVGNLDLTGTVAANGTTARYLDETCADAGGGASACSPDGLPFSEIAFGPLCELAATATEPAVIGAAKQMMAVGTNPYTVTIDYVFEAFGPASPASNLSALEDLTAVFGTTPADWTFTSIMTTGGPGTFAANAGFNGAGATELINPGSSLATGEVGQVQVVISVTTPGTYVNQILFTGQSPSGNPTTDLSTDGTDPDPDGDGNPNEEVPSVVAFETPAIGAAKQMTAVGTNPYTVTLDYVFENFGDVVLSDLSAPDDLVAVFGATPANWTFTSIATTGGPGTFAANAAYDGSATTELINPGSSLGPGEVGQIQVTISVTTPGTYVNQVTVTGDSPQGTTVMDLSTDGTDPDPNGDGVPDEEEPSVVAFETPVIGAAKQMTGAGTGPFTVTLDYVFENFGDVELTNLSAPDDLVAVFGATPANWTFTSIATTGGPGSFAANAAYNGSGTTELINPGSSLLPGEVGQIQVVIGVTTPGVYVNQVTVSGDSPMGTTVTDLSTDGTDPDPNGDGVPDEEVPSEVMLGHNPSMSAVKTADPVVDNLDGTFTVTFTIELANTGNSDLSNVQATDDLNATFPPSSSVVSVTTPVTLVVGTGTLAANPSYDGDGDTDLLIAAGSTLDVGDAGEITFDVTFDPGNLSSFTNTVVAEGESTLAVIVGDTGDASFDAEAQGPPVDLIEIPTLDRWGFAALIVLLLGIGVAVLRRRSA